MEKQLLTVSQTARLLNLSVERVRQLARNGDLACQSTPLGRLFERIDVEALAARRIAQRGE